MNTRLKHIQNWLQLAKEANWSSLMMAKKCNISVRTLERYFVRELAKSPKEWLSEQRQREAWSLLHKGYSVKEAATSLGYNYPNQFSRDFKRHWGFTPCEIRQAGPIGKSRNVAIRS
jgi:AraC-like DNA-binding protein